MEDVTDIRFEPLAKSMFVNPITMHYKQNGINKIWDMVKLHESVAIILFHSERKSLICVKQFRPAVYYNQMRTSTSDQLDFDIPIEKGITIELCAGIVDKDKDLTSIAQGEILEECGYDVEASKIKHVMSFRGGVGVSGEKQTLFYTEVNDKMKVSEGGGLVSEGEFIDIVEYSIPELRNLLQQPDVNTTPSFLFGVSWFLMNKASQFP